MQIHDHKLNLQSRDPRKRQKQLALKGGFEPLFILHASIYRSVDALFHIRQKDDEGLHELLSRWQSTTARCHNLEPRVAEQAFRQALLPSIFLMEINKNPPGSYDALMDLAVRWARAEFATFGRPAHATLALTAPTPDEHFGRGQKKGQSHGPS